MVKQEAIKYVKSLNKLERTRLKNMLDKNILCCSGIAKDLKLDINDFNAELRRIFKWRKDITTHKLIIGKIKWEI